MKNKKNNKKTKSSMSSVLIILIIAILIINTILIASIINKVYNVSEISNNFNYELFMRNNKLDRLIRHEREWNNKELFKFYPDSINYENQNNKIITYSEYVRIENERKNAAAVAFLVNNNEIREDVKRYYNEKNRSADDIFETKKTFKYCQELNNCITINLEHVIKAEIVLMELEKMMKED